jgi:hypothetical protein
VINNKKMGKGDIVEEIINGGDMAAWSRGQLITR